MGATVLERGNRGFMTWNTRIPWWSGAHRPVNWAGRRWARPLRPSARRSSGRRSMRPIRPGTVQRSGAGYRANSRQRWPCLL